MTVAIVASWPGSALTSRHELAGTGRWLRGGLVAAAAGGTLGVVLLLSTPPGLFERVVPSRPARCAVAILGLVLAVKLWLGSSGT